MCRIVEFRKLQRILQNKSYSLQISTTTQYLSKENLMRCFESVVTAKQTLCVEMDQNYWIILKPLFRQKSNQGKLMKASLIDIFTGIMIFLFETLIYDFKDVVPVKTEIESRYQPKFLAHLEYSDNQSSATRDKKKKILLENSCKNLKLSIEMVLEEMMPVVTE